MTAPATPEILSALRELQGELARWQDWSAAAINDLINGFAAAHGLTLGKLAQPVRLAMCGGSVSPPLDATLAILGKSETLTRLERALRHWS